MKNCFFMLDVDVLCYLIFIVICKYYNIKYCFWEKRINLIRGCMMNDVGCMMYDDR